MNQPLEDWKGNLNESGLFTEEQIWELEDHLHTRIDELLANGHNSEDAARIAALEIGETTDLAQEYTKSNKSKLVKKLLLYFLFGFSLFSAIYWLLTSSWELTAMYLISQGWRGFSLTYLTMIPAVILLFLLSRRTMRDPYWMVDLPERIVALGKGYIFILFSAILSFFYLGNLWYFSYLGNNIKPTSYLQYEVTSWFSPLFYSIIPIGSNILMVVLFLRVVSQAITGFSNIHRMIKQASLASMLLGWFILSRVVSFIELGMYRLGMVDPQGFDQTRTMVLAASVFLVGGLSMFTFYRFFRKNKIFVSEY